MTATAIPSAASRFATAAPMPRAATGDDRHPLCVLRHLLVLLMFSLLNATYCQIPARLARRLVPGCRAGQPVLAQLPVRHRALVHLVGPVGEAQAPGGGPRVRQRELLAHPAAAVRLDRLVDHPLGHRRNRDLDRLDLGVRALVADGVHQPRGLQHQQPGLLDPHPRLGDPVLDDALVGERLAERDPRRWPAGTSPPAPARPRRSAACSGGSGPGRAWPARSRTRRPRRRSGSTAGTRTSANRTSAWPPWVASVKPNTLHARA